MVWQRIHIEVVVDFSNKQYNIYYKNDQCNGDNIVGIIKLTDFANFFSENCIGFASVKDYMSRSFFTISIKENVFNAAQIMSEKKVSRLIVVDPDNQNKLADIISETDISRTDQI